MSSTRMTYRSEHRRYSLLVLLCFAQARCCIGQQTVNCNQSTNIFVSGRRPVYFQWQAIADGNYTVSTCATLTGDTEFIYGGTTYDDVGCGPGNLHNTASSSCVTLVESTYRLA